MRLRIVMAQITLCGLLAFAPTHPVRAQSTVSYFCPGIGTSFNATYSADGDTVMLNLGNDLRVPLASAVSGSGARFVGGGYELHSKGSSALLTRPGSGPVNCEEQGGGGQPVGPRAAPPATQAAGPSFSCAGALGPGERQICNNTELARLDRDMSDAYHGLIARLSRGEQERLRADQRQWLGRRNACASDVSCIEAEYLDRIGYLNEWEAPGSPPSEAAGFPHAAQSWGGVVRSGPGMNHGKIGSLAEGAPITILADTGVEMNGYRWFQIRFGKRTGYQWGGIICPEGRAVPGTFQVCN